MTADEFRNRLQSMSAAEKVLVMKKAGCGNFEDVRYVEMLVAEPSWESRFCYALGIPTESAKVAEATVQQARDQRWSVRLSWIAIAIAVTSLLVSLLR